jgi:NAD(P)-dependent dehydrogenase (short-subunit alcohol dehydrogenase family)
MEQLDGKVAVVTGAGSGIGFALARALAREGMAVVGADIDAVALERAMGSLASSGMSAVGVVTDVADPSSVSDLRDETFSRFGTAHVVCNIAGIPAFQSMTTSMDLGRWRKAIDVNLFGVIHGVATFLPRLLEQDDGYIVNMSSRQGLLGSPSAGAYATSKFAVVGLSEVLDAELRDRGSHVGVSVVCPGAVRTNLMGGATRGQHHLSTQLTQRAVVQIEPEVVADLVVAAIQRSCFYVITHPDTVESLAERSSRIVADAVQLGVVPDAGDG